MDDAVANAWKMLAGKLGELLETTADERDAWQTTSRALGQILERWESSGTPGPSPGEPSGATPTQETPPASDVESAATPTIGRWRESLGKWETREDAGREVADAPTPFAEEQEIEEDTERILEAIKHLGDDIKSALRKSERPSGLSASNDKAQIEPTKTDRSKKRGAGHAHQAARAIGFEALRSAAILGF